MSTYNARNKSIFEIADIIELLESTGQLTRALPIEPDGRVAHPDEARHGSFVDLRGRDPRRSDLLGGPLPASIDEFLSDGRWDDLMGAGWDNPTGDDGYKEEADGFDFAAVYFPIHFYAEQWGIGIRTDSACRLAIRIARENGKWSRRNRPSKQQRLDFLRAALIVYTLHETWHHRVEAAGIRIQCGPLLGGRPVYRDYSAKVYQQTWGTDDCLEEALANAHMLRELKTELTKLDLGHLAPTSHRVARKMVERSSAGYRRGVEFMSTSAWNRGRNELLNSLVSGAINGHLPKLGVELNGAVGSALMRDVHPTFSPHNVKSTVRWIERGLWS